MEESSSICYYSVGGTLDDSRSVSSLTTLLVSNRSNQVSPQTCSMAEIPHQEGELDIDTIDTAPTHEVSTTHRPSSWCESSLTASDNSEPLDKDLQDELRDRMEHAKKDIKMKQRKRNHLNKIKRKAKPPEHEDHKKPSKKRRDDEDDMDGNEGDGKPAAAAAAAPSKAVSAK